MIFFSFAKIAAIQMHQKGLKAQKEPKKFDKEFEHQIKATEKKHKIQKFKNNI